MNPPGHLRGAAIPGSNICTRAENTDKKGRALNRRVEVKVLVNKGLQDSSQVATASF